MDLMKMLTPVDHVSLLQVTDTVGDAYDQLESHDLTAAPLVDGNGRYLGTITEADLRRHLTGRRDRAQANATPLGEIERHAHNPPVTVGQGLGPLSMRAAGHGFVPVVDRVGKLVGIIDRRKLSHVRFPSAA